MIIPLNLPGEKSKALSIVATTEGYSVALVDIVDGYGLHACESYELLIPTDEEVIEPYRIWLRHGPDYKLLLLIKGGENHSGRLMLGSRVRIPSGSLFFHPQSICRLFHCCFVCFIN